MSLKWLREREGMREGLESIYL